MTALVTFLQTYAIWIYILCGVGFLLAAKRLFDARRLALTAQFSLDNERAREQYYRGIALILFLILAACAVTGINIFVAPVVPSPESPIVRVPTATFFITIAAVTPIPSAPTPALPRATEIPAAIAPPPAIAPTRTPTRTSPPPAPATATSFALPAPVIKGPIPNGGAWTGPNQDASNLVFRWEWKCEPCVLGPSDDFIVSVSFADKNTGAPRSVAGTTRENFLSLATIARGMGVEVWHQAKENSYMWNVQVRRGGQALTPPSETWKFIWH